jgi:alcohol dehydrogenase class IV
MMPAIAICDPELTVGMPRVVTAGTGLDAFAHCLEAYCAPFYHPLADGVAVEGMRLVKEYLPRAYRSHTDLEARGNMMAAAAMGAMAFQKGLGAIHALSHPIGALYDTHHGMTNAVVMPAVLAANRPAIEAKIVRLSAYLGLSGGFDGFMTFVRELRADLAVPDTLVEFGVPRGAFDRIRDMSVNDPTAGGNPIELTADLATRMLETAFGV